MNANVRVVLARLSDCYSPEEAHRWLHTWHHLLENRPVDSIRAGRTDEVLSVIERLGSGAYL